MRARASSFAAAAIAAMLFVIASPAWALTYPGQSLIIPVQAEYQNKCGNASAYGLVYKVLQANEWLAAQGYNRITVHWAFSTVKHSPNRCVPTNLNVPPPYGTYSASFPPPWNDPNWNDGCDFHVQDTTSVPVNQIVNATPTTSANTTITTYDTSVATQGTTSTASGNSTAVTITYPSGGIYPGYPATVIQHTTSTTTDVTQVQYLGGAFIISAADVPMFETLLSSAKIGGTYANALDQNNLPISFTTYATSSTCTFGTTAGDYVNIHQAQTSFTAPDSLEMNQIPYRIALLESTSGSGGGTTHGVSNGILEVYLTDAGLNFSGAGGCPVGGYDLAHATSYCSNGTKIGDIYDSFDVQDLNNGLLYNTLANGKNAYGVVWTPHWETQGIDQTLSQPTHGGSVAIDITSTPTGLYDGSSTAVATSTTTGGTIYVDITGKGEVGEATMKVCLGNSSCTTAAALYNGVITSPYTVPGTGVILDFVGPFLSGQTLTNTTNGGTVSFDVTSSPTSSYSGTSTTTGTIYVDITQAGVPGAAAGTGVANINVCIGTNNCTSAAAVYSGFMPPLLKVPTTHNGSTYTGVVLDFSGNFGWINYTINQSNNGGVISLDSTSSPVGTFTGTSATTGEVYMELKQAGPPGTGVMDVYIGGPSGTEVASGLTIPTTAWNVPDPTGGNTGIILDFSGNFGSQVAQQVIQPPVHGGIITIDGQSDPNSTFSGTSATDGEIYLQYTKPGAVGVATMNVFIGGTGGTEIANDVTIPTTSYSVPGTGVVLDFSGNFSPSAYTSAVTTSGTGTGTVAVDPISAPNSNYSGTASGTVGEWYFEFSKPGGPGVGTFSLYNGGPTQALVAKDVTIPVSGVYTVPGAGDVTFDLGGSFTDTTMSQTVTTAPVHGGSITIDSTSQAYQTYSGTGTSNGSIYLYFTGFGNEGTGVFSTYIGGSTSGTLIDSNKTIPANGIYAVPGTGVVLDLGQAVTNAYFDQPTSSVTSTLSGSGESIILDQSSNPTAIHTTATNTQYVIEVVGAGAPGTMKIALYPGPPASTTATLNQYVVPSNGIVGPLAGMTFDFAGTFTTSFGNSVTGPTNGTVTVAAAPTSTPHSDYQGTSTSDGDIYLQIVTGGVVGTATMNVLIGGSGGTAVASNVATAAAYTVPGTGVVLDMSGTFQNYTATYTQPSGGGSVSVATTSAPTYFGQICIVTTKAGATGTATMNVYTGGTACSTSGSTGGTEVATGVVIPASYTMPGSIGVNLTFSGTFVKTNYALVTLAQQTSDIQITAIPQAIVQVSALSSTDSATIQVTNLPTATATISNVAPDSAIVTVTNLPTATVSVNSYGLPDYATVTVSTTSSTTDTASVEITDLPTVVEQGATAAISEFLNGQTGYFGECASIASMEGAAQGSSGGYSGASQEILGSKSSQLLTCVSDPANPGSCLITAPYMDGLDNNIVYPASAGGEFKGGTVNGTSSSTCEVSPCFVFLKNCTDPDMSGGYPCMYYDDPGDSYMQVGNYMFLDYWGFMMNFFPNTGQTNYNSQYQSGVLPLASNIISWNPAYGNAGQVLTHNNLVVSDEIVRTTKENNSGKGAILYMAGHTYDEFEAGTRIVLATLVQLGLVYASAETGYTGPTYYNNSVFVPTYNRITSTPSNVAVQTYDWTAGSQFVFPYHSGHLKTHLLSALQSGNNNYTQFVQWDAALSIPLPGARNIFTYLDGDVIAPSSQLARQAGWTAVDFDASQIQSPVSTCVDKYSLGNVAANTSTGKPGPYAGQVLASDGICDLETEVAQNMILLPSDLGSDNGTSASEQTAIKSKMLDNSIGGAIQQTKQLVQLVRGFCYATTGGQDGAGTMNPASPAAGQGPATASCNYKAQSNTATLGGFVHSQVAVIPPSPYIQDLPSGKHRPVVAFAGGLDGMLHAFYVPGVDTNDSGYTGPAQTMAYPLLNGPGSGSATSFASGVFHTSYGGTNGSTPFTPPAPSTSTNTPTGALTELWAFIPPGQLGMLWDNNAEVDSAPAVTDVFGDFQGTGIRQWHTVLLASAGGENREIFAIDVTNPLNPVLLWDIESSMDTEYFFAPVRLMDDNTGFESLGDEQALLWQNRCRQADVTSGACSPASFVLPPATDPGRTVTGLFNYVHLGASQSISAGLLRRNNAPTYAAFAATNEPGGQGMYVFAIDIASGQKIWEFNNPYDKANDPVNMAAALDNTPPNGVSLVSKAGNAVIDTVYVGDLEGSLFELDAADGLNNTGYAAAFEAAPGTYASKCTTGGSWPAGLGCNFALVNAYGYDLNNYPQPITTEDTVFIVPPGISASSPFAGYVGETLLAFGTAGTDAVSALNLIPAVTGSIHILDIGPAFRSTAAQLITSGSTAISAAQAKGVGQEVTSATNGTYPYYVPTVGERLYGDITADGSSLFFATTSGTVTSIDTRGNLGGSTYSLNMNVSAGSGDSNALTAIATGAGGAGGSVLVINNASGSQATVVTVTDQNINVVTNTNVGSGAAGSAQSSAVNGTGQTPSEFDGWFFRTTGHEY